MAEVARNRTLRAAGWAALAALTAWTMYPALSSVHVEAYIAQLQAMAMMLARGGIEGIRAFDTYMPLPAEFIYLTRAGIVWLLAGIHAASGGAGDWGFRGLVLVSVAVIAGASVVFARRWGRVPPAASLLALLLVPGLSELGFVLSDNVVSAAFAALGLAAVGRRGSLPGHAAAGALLGFAVFCRLDAALVLPMLGGLALMGHPSLALVARRGAASGAGLISCLVAGFLFGGVNVFDAVEVARTFSDGRLGSYPDVVVLFIGAPIITMLALGFWWNARFALRSAGFWWAACFVAAPAGLVLASLHLSSNLRYVLPLLAPFLALHGGRGIDLVLRRLLSPGWRGRAVAVLAASLVAVPLAMPPNFESMVDGPHSAVGRLWTAPHWREWQERAWSGILRTRAWADAAAAAGGSTLIVTAHFEDDFHLRQRLIDNGYAVRMGRGGEPGCAGLFVYELDRSKIVHVRAEPPYWLTGMRGAVEPVMLAAALGCSEAFAPDRAYLSTLGRDTLRHTPDLYRDIADRVTDPGEIQFLRLSKEDLDGLRSAANALAERSFMGQPRPRFEDILRIYGSRHLGSHVTERN